MTREHILACVKIGAAAATILTFLGGPTVYVLYTLDTGVREATTRCESQHLSELSYLTDLRANRYEAYLNAKLNLLSIHVGEDVRPKAEKEKTLIPSVEEHIRDTSWEEVKQLGGQIENVTTRLENCPDYGGIIQ